MVCGDGKAELFFTEAPVLMTYRRKRAGSPTVPAVPRLPDLATPVAIKALMIGRSVEIV
jgi:hypothetical protein